MDIKKVLLITLIAIAVVASVSAVSAGLFDGLFGGGATYNAIGNAEANNGGVSLGEYNSSTGMTFQAIDQDENYYYGYYAKGNSSEATYVIVVNLNLSDINWTVENLDDEGSNKVNDEDKEYIDTYLNENLSETLKKDSNLYGKVSYYSQGKYGYPQLTNDNGHGEINITGNILTYTQELHLSGETLSSDYPMNLTLITYNETGKISHLTINVVIPPEGIESGNPEEGVDHPTTVEWL